MGASLWLLVVIASLRLVPQFGTAWEGAPRNAYCRGSSVDNFYSTGNAHICQAQPRIFITVTCLYLSLRYTFYLFYIA